MFVELSLRLAGDDRYLFFQLGVPQGPALPDNVRNVPVRVAPERRDAIVEAIAEARIEVVVSWSVWPETFCFTVHEALAGGAFVVARADAGNAWRAVTANAPGQDFSSPYDAGVGEAVYRFFHSRADAAVVPFAYIGNKLFMTGPAHAKSCKDRTEQFVAHDSEWQTSITFRERAAVARRMVETKLLGHDTLILP